MYQKLVSVSLWSIIHSYILYTTDYPRVATFGVSVSLWSIIHSYSYKSCDRDLRVPEFPSPYGVSFILINLKF